ncbi:ABC transporter ATP-binding protein [Marinobacterium mangrovicola]|uniref:ABC-type dipeptide transporter n=1 Tax=Marinobacterium mangrovicola TaxID=1476959 RepID=A0A4R1GDS8_9GAMM|nr:ABC transporter ATP-binding protein [Marinobacterium mangrovicola]TCK04765.1 peptide/nickel transport system ATP-binding protein [Marinobacterium mangrovicola]
MNPVLKVEDLSIRLPEGADRPYAVNKLSYSLYPGEILCVVGESGSGKSMTANAVMGLLPKAIQVDKGAIIFDGKDLISLEEKRARDLRGNRISMIFQEPMTALNPLMRVEDQIGEVFLIHSDLSKQQRKARTLELLKDVGLPDPEKAMRVYPHQLSGGQRQRVMIAMALALEPSILIADEPTTALDVTTQAQILHLIKELQRKHGTAVMFITHDFGVVAEIADRVVVMQYGDMVEIGSREQVLNQPQHPYTKKLIAAVPPLSAPDREIEDRAGQSPALSVKSLCKTYVSPGGWFKPARTVHAAQDVSFDLYRGETLGLVGESGSGKSTVSRCIVRLLDSDSGEILLGGSAIQDLDHKALAPFRKQIQMVFQDPYASLNPRKTVGRIIADGPIAQGVPVAEAMDRARELLKLVELPETALDRYPHEFSGGQRQRVGIARALAHNPQVLVADEAISALDVSVQAQILELIDTLKKKLNLAVLFVVHDLRVAAQVCDRVIVMQHGKIVEAGNTKAVFEDPQHTYTQNLIASIPGADWRSEHQPTAVGQPA